MNYTGSNFQIGAGDFHEQLGRGIMLSLRPRAGAGLDIAIQGGKFVLESDNLTWNTFGGIANTINRDVVLDVFVEDKPDIIAGTQIELQTPWDFNVGLMSSYVQPVEQILPEETDLTVSYGAFADFPQSVTCLFISRAKDRREGWWVRKIMGLRSTALAILF